MRRSTRLAVRQSLLPSEDESLQQESITTPSRKKTDPKKVTSTRSVRTNRKTLECTVDEKEFTVSKEDTCLGESTISDVSFLEIQTPVSITEIKKVRSKSRRISTIKKTEGRTRRKTILAEEESTGTDKLAENTEKKEVILNEEDEIGNISTTLHLCNSVNQSFEIVNKEKLESNMEQHVQEGKKKHEDQISSMMSRSDSENIHQDANAVSVSGGNDIKEFQSAKAISDGSTDKKKPNEDTEKDKNDLRKNALSNEDLVVKPKYNLKKFGKIGSLNPDKIKQGFLFAKKESKVEGLLKLTSDALRSLPFKITKKDLQDEQKAEKLSKETCKSDDDKLEIIPVTSSEMDKSKIKTSITLSSELDPGINLDNLYFSIESDKTKPVERKVMVDKCGKQKEILKKSNVGPDFEKTVRPQIRETGTQKIKKKRREREETAGPGWYDLPKTELTEDMKRDMQVIKMRHLLNPKRFYKKGTNKFPKHFQLGTVVDGAADFYSSRIPRKERKRTMVDELLNDAEFRRRNKRKFLEIQKSKEHSRKKHPKVEKKKKKNV